MKALLLDLDDTLYDYTAVEAAARSRLAAVAAMELGVSEPELLARYSAARRAVKARCDTPSGHARLLYLHELLHRFASDTQSLPRLERARSWEQLFWQEYLQAAALRPAALDLLRGLRAAQWKIAIVTDLTLDIQLQKIAHFGLEPFLDALVASEEVGVDKPAAAPFRLAAERLGVELGECVMVGDSDDKDGAGARALGIPFYRVRTPESAEGYELSALLDLLLQEDR